jgi:transposase-like protein
MRPKPDPAVVARAVEAVRRGGRSLADVAREHGVSKMTVKRWADAAEPRPDIAERAARIAAATGLGAAPEPPAAPPAADAASDVDTLEMARRSWRECLARARAAEAEGNHTAAQRSGRDAAAWAVLVARLEKTAAVDADVLRISRAEVDEAMAGIRTRVESIVSRPLLCAHCSRALSASWGGRSEK